MNCRQPQNLLFAFLLTMLVACDSDENETIDSDAVATGQIFATFQIIADGEDYVNAEAQLTRGVSPANSDTPETFVRLVDGDELWFSTGEDIDNSITSNDIFAELQNLEETQNKFSSSTAQKEVFSFIYSQLIINTFGNWYSARLPQSDDNTYKVSLFRDNNSDATNSRITLPQAFATLAPARGATFSRSMDDIIIEWNNTEPNVMMEIEANSSCPNGASDSYSTSINTDPGNYTFAAGELASIALVGNCSTTLNIRKIRIGEFDNRFIGGSVNGYQIRRITIRTSD